MGFNIAFGLSNFDATDQFIEDPDYATIAVQMRSWGWEKTDALFQQELTRHLCTREELGLDYYDTPVDERGEMEEPRFYSPEDYNKEWFQVYWPKMWCLDKNP